jgi:Clp amino terminal domain, pathogenicity island component
VRESDGTDDSCVGAEHIALALTRIKQGLVPPILAEAGITAEALRAAILDRHRLAS